MVPLSPPTSIIRLSGKRAKLVNTPRNVSERSLVYEYGESGAIALYTPMRLVGVPTINSGPLFTIQWAGSGRFLNKGMKGNDSIWGLFFYFVCYLLWAALSTPGLTVSAKLPPVDVQGNDTHPKTTHPCKTSLCRTPYKAKCIRKLIELKLSAEALDANGTLRYI